SAKGLGDAHCANTTPCLDVFDVLRGLTPQGPSIRSLFRTLRQRAQLVRQIDSPTSPSSTDVFSRGRSPLLHSAALSATRYRRRPPSGLALRVMGRGMQTNSVRISSADNRTFA